MSKFCPDDNQCQIFSMESVCTSEWPPHLNISHSEPATASCSDKNIFLATNQTPLQPSQRHTPGVNVIDKQSDTLHQHQNSIIGKQTQDCRICKLNHCYCQCKSTDLQVMSVKDHFSCNQIQTLFDTQNQVSMGIKLINNDLSLSELKSNYLTFLNQDDTVSVNKTTLQYSSEKNRLKYSIPTYDQVDESSLYQDKRNHLEIFRDIVLKIANIIPPHLASLWQSIARYRIEIPQVNKDGFCMIKQELKNMIKSYARDARHEEQPIIKETLNALEKPTGAKLPPANYTIASVTSQPFRPKIKLSDDCSSQCFQISIQCQCSNKKRCQGKCILYDYQLSSLPQCKCSSSTFMNNQSSIMNDIESPSFLCNMLIDDFPLTLAEKRSVKAIRKKKERICMRHKKYLIQLLVKYKIIKCQKCSASCTTIERSKKHNGFYCQVCRQYLDQQQTDQTKIDQPILCNNTQVQSSLPYIRALLGSKVKHQTNSVMALIDSGCDANLLAEHEFNKLDKNIYILGKSKKTTLQTADGKRTQAIIGQVEIDVYFYSKGSYYREKVNFFIVSNKFILPGKQCILGNNFFKQTNAKISFNPNGLEADLKNKNNFIQRIFIPCTTEESKIYNCPVNQVVSVGDQDSKLIIETGNLPQGLYHAKRIDDDKSYIVQVTNTNPILCLENSSQNYWPIDIFQENQPYSVIHINNVQVRDKYLILQRCEIEGRKHCQLCDELIAQQKLISQECGPPIGNNVAPQKCGPPSSSKHTKLQAPEECNSDLDKQLSKQKCGPPVSEKLISQDSGPLTTKNVAPQESWHNEHTAPQEDRPHKISELKSEVKYREDESCPLHCFHLHTCNQHSNHTCEPDPHVSENTCPCPVRAPETTRKQSPVMCNKIYTQTKENTIVPSEHNVGDELFKSTDLMTALPKASGEIKLKHLDGQLKSKVEELVTECAEAFATPQKKTGSFRYWEADIEVADAHKAKQKDRRIDFSKNHKARDKVLEMLKTGLLQECDHPVEAVANFVIVKKPLQDSHLRQASKADKQQARKNEEELLHEGATPDVRMTVDMTTLNRQIVGRHDVQLPSLAEVKMKIRNHYTSSFDIQDGYNSIKLNAKTTRYMNVYFQNKILTFRTLVQGIKSAPYIFCSAMKATLDDKILTEIVQQQQWTDKEFPFTSFEDFTSHYIDDIVIFSPKEMGKEMHIRVLKCLFLAIQRSGLLLSKKKSQIFCEEFQYLGQTINSHNSTSSLSDERCQSMLEMRRPLSCGEILSRLGMFHWSAEYLPLARLISLPLHRTAHSGKYKWTQLEEEAFTELKFLASLKIKSHIFDSQLPTYVYVDSSKVSSSYFMMQLNHDGKLLDVATNTTILSQAQISSPSVLRECAGLNWAISSLEKYILACKKNFSILTDCSCLSYITRNKNHTSKFFETAVSLSRYPHVSIIYIPGRTMAAADQMSRNYVDIYIKGKNKLSEKFAQLIPPLPKSLKNKLMKMTPIQLQSFLMSSQPSHYLDVNDKRLTYTQNTFKPQIEESLKIISDEQSLFAFLTDAWNNKEIIKVPIIREMIKKQSILSKTSYQEILKKYKLAGLYQQLQQLDIEPKSFLKSLKRKEDAKDIEIGEKQVDQSFQINLVQTRRQKYLNQQNEDLNTELIEPVKNAIKGIKQMQNEYPNQFQEPTDQSQVNQESTDQSQESIINMKNTPTLYPSALTKEQPSNRVNSPDENWDTIKCSCHTQQELSHLQPFILNIKRISIFIKLIAELMNTCIYDINMSQLLQKYESETCLIRKYNNFAKIFQHFQQDLVSAHVFFKNTQINEDKSTPISFYAYNYSSISLKHQLQNSKILFFLTKSINIEPYQICCIKIQLFISASAKIFLEINSEISKNLHIEPNWTTADGLQLSNIFLFNITDENILIPKETLIFHCYFLAEGKQNCQYLPIQISEEIIKNKMMLLHNFRNKISLEKLSNIHSKYIQYTYQQLDPLQINTEEGKMDQNEKNIIKCNNISTNQKKFVKQSSEGWKRFLNSLLQCCVLQKRNHQFLTSDIISMQKADEELEKIRTLCEKNAENKYKKYILIDNLLFYQNTSELNSTQTDKLCVPSSFIQLVGKTYHNIRNLHLSKSSLENLLGNLFYCPNMSQECKRITSSCLTCNFNSEYLKYSVYGTERSHQNKHAVGQIFNSDVVYLPKTNYSIYSYAIVFAEAVTGYLSVFPLKKLDSHNCERALYQFLCTTGHPQIIVTDGGSEYLGSFMQLAANQNIMIQTSAIGKSNPNGAAEVSIKILKKELNKIVNSTIPNTRKEWHLALPTIVAAINNARLNASIFSRRQLFYHPTIYVHETGPAFDIADAANEDIPYLHYLNLTRLKRIRDEALKKKHSTLKRDILVKGLICKIIRGDKTAPTVDGAKSLLPTLADIVKIISFHPPHNPVSCNVTSLLDGTKRNVLIENIRPLDGDDIIGLKLNPEDLFGHVSQCRVNTRYRALAEPVQFTTERGHSRSPKAATKVYSICQPDTMPIIKCKSILKPIRHPVQPSDAEKFDNCTSSEQQALKSAEHLCKILNSPFPLNLYGHATVSKPPMSQRIIPVDKKRKKSERRIQFNNDTMPDNEYKARSTNLHCLTVYSQIFAIITSVSGKELAQIL